MISRKFDFSGSGFVLGSLTFALGGGSVNSFSGFGSGG